MTFTKLVSQTAQRSARNFSSKESSIKNIFSSNSEQKANGWLQSIGARSSQQDYGQLDKWDISGVYNLDSEKTINQAFEKGHQAMQKYPNSGTVASGMLLTKDAVTLYSCGDSGVALFFPESMQDDGAPIHLPPAQSNDVVVGKRNGAELRVGGYSAIANIENFPEVSPIPRIKSISKDEMSELQKQHGPAMTLLYSDGVYAAKEKDLDFEELYHIMQYNENLSNVPELAMHHMFKKARWEGQNTDNKTIYFNHLQQDTGVTNIILCDGHGREGEKVAKTVAQETSKIVESGINVLYRNTEQNLAR